MRIMIGLAAGIAIFLSGYYHLFDKRGGYENKWTASEYRTFDPS